MEEEKTTEVVVNEKNEPTAEEQQEEKKFTQDELNSIIAREKNKWEKKAKEEQEEAKKKAKMSAEEKANFEFNQKNEKLQEREREIVKRELTATAKEILADKKLPTDLHSILNYEDEEVMKESIEVIEKAINTAVDKMVSEKLKGSTPKRSVPEEKTPKWVKDFL